MLRGQTNSKNDTFKVLHHIIVAEAQYAISAGCKPLIASVVMAKTRFEVVTFAVDLNDQLAGMRDEVCDVVTHGALSAKSHSCKSMCLQTTPQQGFGTRHRAS